MNPDCPDYQKRNTGKIIKKGFNAKGKYPKDIAENKAH